MHYAINSRASVETGSELATDLMVLDVISNFSTPESLSGQGEVTITEAEVVTDLPVVIEVIGSEMVDDVEVEVTNRQTLIDTVELQTAEWQEAKIHSCAHDEAINRPCSPWEVCQQHGTIPEVEM
jgi:hypothetical protein